MESCAQYVSEKKRKVVAQKSLREKIIDDEIKRLTVKRFANNGMLSLKYEAEY